VIPNDSQVADCVFLLPLLPKKEEGWGENSPTKDSRIEPLNLEKPTTSVSLAPSGGEGWGEGALRVQGKEALRVHGESERKLD
jgi:hypothetical protein